MPVIHDAGHLAELGVPQDAGSATGVLDDNLLGSTTRLLDAGHFPDASGAVDERAGRFQRLEFLQSDGHGLSSAS